MPFMVLVADAGKRRPTYLVRKARRSKALSALEEWIEAFCAMTSPPPIVDRKCEHGVYRGGEVEGACTVCTEYRVAGFNTPDRERFQSSPYVEITNDRDRLGKTSLFPVKFKGGLDSQGHQYPPQNFPKIERHGKEYLSFRERWVRVTPVDFDDRKKMYADEAQGGYIRRGGIAVRAGKGYGHKVSEKDGSESFVLLDHKREPMSSVTLPAPDGDIGEYRPELAVPIITRDLSQYRPQPTIVYIGKLQQQGGGMRAAAEKIAGERRAGAARRERDYHEEALQFTFGTGVDWFFFYLWELGLLSREQQRVAARKLGAWSRKYRDEHNRPEPICEAAGKREPWCGCLACQKWFPDGTRSADWRTDRRMRDLEARLEMFAYGDKGDRLYRPTAIERKAILSLDAAWHVLASFGTGNPHWKQDPVLAVYDTLRPDVMAADEPPTPDKYRNGSRLRTSIGFCR